MSLICPTNCKNFHIIKMLGKGSFGKVLLGIELLTNKYVAVKTI